MVLETFDTHIALEGFSMCNKEIFEWNRGLWCARVREKTIREWEVNKTNTHYLFWRAISILYSIVASCEVTIKPRNCYSQPTKQLNSMCVVFFLLHHFLESYVFPHSSLSRTHLTSFAKLLVLGRVWRSACFYQSVYTCLYSRPQGIIYSE